MTIGTIKYSTTLSLNVGGDLFPALVQEGFQSVVSGFADGNYINLDLPNELVNASHYEGGTILSENVISDVGQLTLRVVTATALGTALITMANSMQSRRKDFIQKAGGAITGTLTESHVNLNNDQIKKINYVLSGGYLLNRNGTQQAMDGSGNGVKEFIIEGRWNVIVV